MSAKIKIGLFGSTGYTGEILAKEVAKRSDLEIVFQGGREKANEDFINSLRSEDLDLVFFATPNAFCYKYAASLIEKGIKIIDLSADYRFQNLDTYEKWYGAKRTDHQLSAEAVYGLVEFNREQIRGKSLIGNPGCYTTSASLALGPLIEAKPKSFDPRSIIIDGKSGYSGAGRKAVDDGLAEKCKDNFSPYKLAGQHRHAPELEEFFSSLCGQNVELSFSPHLVPMFQGLLTTCYINLSEDISEQELREIYQAKYSSEPDTKLLEPGAFPQTKNTVGTNKAEVQVCYEPRLKRVIATCAIDNLYKGAATQALQNMDLIFQSSCKDN